MFKNTTRISELQNKIAELKAQIIEQTGQANSLHSYGKMQAALLGKHFATHLIANGNKAVEWWNEQSETQFHAWTSPKLALWNPSVAMSDQLPPIIRVGTLNETKSDLSFVVPANAPFIGQGKTIIITGRQRGLELLQSLVVRTALLMPHQARYTLLDPAGNGIAFPMRKDLPFVRDSVGDTARELQQIITDIQRIIRDYLSQSVKSFEQISFEQRLNERFQFVFAADFPNQYDRRAIEALQNIATTGPSAGVYLFIHWNQSHPLPRDMNMEGFKQAFYISADGDNRFTSLGLSLQLDQSPQADIQEKLFIKSRSIKAPERKIDWEQIAGISEQNWWTGSADQIIETSVGARGTGDKLNLWFGERGDLPCAHGMLGAMTGAGKSNLYHVLIGGLAIRYNPAELRLYLIDGKDGVGFEAYRQLPHAEVVSLKTSPELSRSVLGELVAEKERRNAMFSRVGVSDFKSYRRKGQPEGLLPRILLLVDEYQELFEGDKDGVASSYLLQLAQQGRSAGIHMLLASQQFGAAGMLNQNNIFNNFHLRMAMKMTSAAVQSLVEFGRNGKSLIATCDLPGKIVVNDQGGDDNANLAGKVAFLSDDRRNQILMTLNKKAESLPDNTLPRRIIFSGKNQPNLLDNPDLNTLLRHSQWMSPNQMETLARQPSEVGGFDIPDWFAAERPYIAWLGQQFTVRGQASLVLRRRSSENALIIGSNNAARYGILAAILVSLATNANRDQTQFIILDRSIPGAQWSQTLTDVSNAVLTPAAFKVRLAKETSEIERAIDDLIAELDRRRKLDEATILNQPSIFILLTESDRIEMLKRRADSYGMAADSEMGKKLIRLCSEGPSVGIHCMLSFTGVRVMASVIDEKRHLGHFRHRVALQMSEDESFNFVRSRQAALLQRDGALPISALYVDMENDRAIKLKAYTTDNNNAQTENDLKAQLKVIGQILKQKN